MKHLKKLLIIAALAMGAFTNVSAQSVEKQSVGVQFIYGTDVENFGVGAFYRHGITSNIRVEGGLDYFFKNHGVGLLQINANGHYLFPLDSDLSIYPLAGLTLMSTTGSGSNLTRLGVNLGGGLEYALDKDLALKFEAKYALAKDIDQLVLNLGLVYRF